MSIWEQIPHEQWERVLDEIRRAREARRQRESEIEGAQRVADDLDLSEAEIAAAWEAIKDRERREATTRVARETTGERRRRALPEWLTRARLHIAVVGVLLSLTGLGLWLAYHVANAGVVRPAVGSEQAYAQARVHLRRAELLFREHSREEAKAAAREAISLAPGLVEAHKLIGACCLVDQDAAGAAEAYGEATRLDPEDPEAAIGLATALEAEGRARDAQRWYEHVLGNPRSTGAQRDQAKRRLASEKG